jgi:3',5'-cyclic-AMP phosphodiesterase
LLSLKQISVLPSPLPLDITGIVSWVQIGDLHLTTAAEQNFADMRHIAEQLNARFAANLNFVFLPGDHAENGRPEQYELVRSVLDQLRLPWFSTVGDHDVHSRTFDLYCRAMLPLTHYALEVGNCRFIALNTFSDPAPHSFILDELQFAFLEQQLESATSSGMNTVLLMHCYPSDLRQGYERLRELIFHYRPLLVAMGHTHYNEIARDEATVYSTTRSTGQIEEGPVGFSITNIDGGCVSWKFKDLASVEPFVMITSPADWRLTPSAAGKHSDIPPLRIKVWSAQTIRTVNAEFTGQKRVPLEQIPGTNVWQEPNTLLDGCARVRVIAGTEDGQQGIDEIELQHIASAQFRFAHRDQDNAIGAWPERGVLGTQLGPNKNGRNW